MSVADRRNRGRSPAHHDYAREPVSDPAVVRERQRDEYGGTNWGAAFFGWLVAVGLGALLTALVTAAGAAIAISEFESVGDASSETETIGLAGGIALLAVAVIAYFAGGYVAGERGGRGSLLRARDEQVGSPASTSEDDGARHRTSSGRLARTG